MPQYVFRIRQGTDASDVPVDLADHDAAWHEGTQVCSDLMRDAVARLRDNPEWRLEVCDENGERLHLFRLTAETFRKE
jgi:CHAD domain-containing protein